MTYTEFREKSLNSIRPITFYSQKLAPSYYNYWLGGTGFFLSYAGRDIFITARHVFEKSNILTIFKDTEDKLASFFLIKEFNNKDLKNPDTRISIKEIYMHSVPHNDMIEDSTGLLSYDENDIAIIELFTNQNKKIFIMPASIALYDMKDIEEPTIGDNLWVSGHPSAENYFEYIDDRNHANLYTKRMHLYGEYVDKNDGIGTMRIIEDSGLKNYRGFSGSPVFKINIDDNTYKLAGMVIRGTKLSKKIFFITINYLFMYIFRSDIGAMFLGYKSSDKEIDIIITKLKKLGIVNIESIDSMLKIQLFNKSYISINPSHHYILQALYILLKYPDIVTSENIYTIQELIVFTNSDSDILKILSKKKITIEFLETIKVILSDYDIRHNHDNQKILEILAR